MRLLLISNSTNPGEPYLDYPKNAIRQFLGEQALKAIFIPYAAVTFSYDEYEEKVVLIQIPKDMPEKQENKELMSLLKLILTFS